MRLAELTIQSKPLLEGINLRVYEELLPFFLLNEDGEGGDAGGGVGVPAGDTSGPPQAPDLGVQPTPPTVPVVTPPPLTVPMGGGWYQPGPFRPNGSGMNGNHWFNQLYSTLKSLAISSNISKRLKELGITGDGAARVRLAQKTAAKHVKLLLSNPGATAYRIPVWTTATPPKTVIKIWNEEYKKEFAKQLSLIKVL